MQTMAICIWCTFAPSNFTVRCLRLQLVEQQRPATSSQVQQSELLIQQLFLSQSSFSGRRVLRLLLLANGYASVEHARHNIKITPFPEYGNLNTGVNTAFMLPVTNLKML